MDAPPTMIIPVVLVNSHKVLVQKESFILATVFFAIDRFYRSGLTRESLRLGHSWTQECSTCYKFYDCDSCLNVCADCEAHLAWCSELYRRLIQANLLAKELPLSDANCAIAEMILALLACDLRIDFSRQ